MSGEPKNDIWAKADRAPAAFLPYQQAWMEDSAQVKICEKSRRIGLSWAEAGEDALLASRTNGMDVFYMGYIKDMAEEFIEDCAMWSKHFKLAASSVEEDVFKDGSEREIRSFRIRFASGHKIEALSSAPRNLRSRQGKVVLDEAAFHDDPGGVLKAAMALLIWGGRVVIISTHNGEDNPFNELINDVRAGRKPYSLHRVDFDDALSQGLYRRVCYRQGNKWTVEGEAEWRRSIVEVYGDDAEEELFCVPSQGSGTFFTRGLIEKCMKAGLPVLRYSQPASFAELPDHVRYAEVNEWCEDNLLLLLEALEFEKATYFGEDFGRYVDLTVMLPLVEKQTADLVAPFVVELSNLPFQQQEQIMRYIIDRLPRFRAGAFDATGNGSYLAERAMQFYGSRRIAQVMISDAFYRENMPRYKACFEDGTITLPRDADIIADHKAVKKVRGVPKLPEVRQTGKGGAKRHGDSAIAGLMAVYAAYVMEGGAEAGQVSSRGRRGMEKESSAYGERVNYGLY